MHIIGSDDDDDSLLAVGDDDYQRDGESRPTMAQDGGSHPGQSSHQTGGSAIPLHGRAGEGESRVATQHTGRVGRGRDDSAVIRRRSSSPDRSRPVPAPMNVLARRGPRILGPRTDKPPQPRLPSPATQSWMRASEQHVYAWAEERMLEREAQLRSGLAQTHVQDQASYEAKFREVASAYELQHEVHAAQVQRNNVNQLAAIHAEMRGMQARTDSLHAEFGRAYHGEARLQQELHGLTQARQGDQRVLNHTRGEAEAVHEATLRARTVAEQEAAAMQQARSVAEHEAAATQYARNVAQREANAAINEASAANAMMQERERARRAQSEHESQSTLEFVALRRELEEYQAREVARTNEDATRRLIASSRLAALGPGLDEQVSSYRIHTPSPQATAPARDSSRTLQSPRVLLQQPRQSDSILEDGYDALDPYYWIGHEHRVHQRGLVDLTTACPNRK